MPREPLLTADELIVVAEPSGETPRPDLLMRRSSLPDRVFTFRPPARATMVDTWSRAPTHPPATRAVLANEGEERMSMITIPRTTSSTGLPTCPWWCTAGPDGHAWQLDRVGGTWARLHHRQVGGFTMSATEWIAHDGDSRVEMHPTRADFVLVDGAGSASELSEDLHLVAAILRRIEAGQGQ